MAGSTVKRIAISLPGSLLEEVDRLVKEGNCNRSEFVRAAMRLYIRVRRHREILNQMQSGYTEMGELNLELAEENLDGSWEFYEEYLMEADPGE
ncbi:MAG: ribbon-helix-helix protein, CopG family [Firmicutes bacterium]|nr:ribbon-helix-helix protein, CopG family [Bacillota bacterium]